MSRQSIMRRIDAALALHCAEQPARRAGLDRRGFLFGGAAALAQAASPALAGAATSAPGGTARPARAGPAGGQRIGIIGGGIAGLVAALTLQDAGWACTVFEASGRVGGRMHSNPDFFAQGQTSEWCGEFIDTDHWRLRSLARRFGLALEDVNAAEPPHSMDTNYLLGSYYTDAELAADLRPVAPVIAQQRSAVGNAYRYDNYNPAARALDLMNAHDWIETYVPGGHASRLGRFLDLGLVSLNGLDTNEQSALNLVVPVRSDERFHVHRGNERIPQAIANQLHAGTVQLGWQMKALAANADATVTVAFATPAGQQALVFDRLILALPFSVLRGLDIARAGFDARKLAMIRQFGYGTNSKLALQFEQRYWNGRGAWPGVGDGFISTDVGFQSTWDSSRAQAGTDGLLTNYTGGSTGAAYRPEGPFTDSLVSATTAAYAAALLPQLEQVWPGITPFYTGRATLSYPTGDPQVLGSYSAFAVGQYTSFCGYGGVAQGPVHFAGEHTSVQFLGYMEGGAETGQRAAQEVMAA